MDIRQINEEYSVTGQISASDIAAVKDAGFASIVCHRPDDEADGQPGFSDIAAAAKAAGIEVGYIPVGKNGVQSDQVNAMVDALDELPRPMLGYCRSGARSTKIYELTAHIRS